MSLDFSKSFVFTTFCVSALLSHSIAQADTVQIFFSTDLYSLTPGHQSELQDHINIRDKNMVTKIDLLGYADVRGSQLYNMDLSQSRAAEVARCIRKVLNDESIPITIHAGGEDAHTKVLSDARRVDIIFHKRPEASHIVGTFEVNEIPIEELKLGSLVRIKNLNFKPGRGVLLPSSIPHLKDLESLLLENPNINIEIQGHVCCPDRLKDYKDGYNVDTKTYDLSIARAENIYHYLVRKGVDEERLSFRGFGWSIPLIYPEESEKDRIQNRRVELLVTKS